MIGTLHIGPRLPDFRRRCLESQLAFHPVRVYAYGPIDNLPAVELADANEILPASRIWYNSLRISNPGSPSGFANEFRLHMLFRNGGFWLDTDCRLKRSLEGIEGEYIVDGRHKHPQNWAMRFPAGHPLLAEMIAVCDATPKPTPFAELGCTLLRRFNVKLTDLSAYMFPHVDEDE